MKPLAVLAQPRSSPSGDRVTVRMYSGPSGAAAGLGGFPWEAVVSRRPRLTIELFTTALDGKTQSGRGDVVIKPTQLRRVSSPRQLYWMGAPVTIYDASNLDLATAPIEFTGFVRSTSYDQDTDQLTLNFEVGTSAMDRPTLFSEFNGGGGINGDPQVRGTLKPAGFGFVQNVPPVWFDNTRNIGMIDGYGNCQSIDALFEGGNSFGAATADYPDYATLAARIDDKTIAPGHWGSCVAQGLVGLGAPPVQPITVDAHFGTNRTGALIRRLLTVHAAIAPALIDAAPFANLDASINRAVHYWTDAQRTVRELVEALAAACNATPLVTFQGLYSITRVFGGGTALTINRQAPTRSTRATQWKTIDPDVPVWRLSARAARPGTTLTTDQILYADTLVDRGLYSVGTVYRQGNTVWGKDGSQWLYINTAALANAPLPSSPALSNAYWSQTKPPLTAANLTYADGSTIEQYKPAEPGADVTGSNAAVGDANRVKLSHLERGLIGWAVWKSAGASAGVFQVIASGGVPYVEAADSFTAAGQSVAIMTNTPDIGGVPDFKIPVNGGERIFASAMVGITIPAGGYWNLNVDFKDESNNDQGSGNIASGIAGVPDGTRFGNFLNTPAAATYCTVQLFINSAGISAGAWDARLGQVMVCSAGPTQTAWPSYAPGASNQATDNATSYKIDALSSYTFPYNSDLSQNFTTRNVVAHLRDQAGMALATGIVWKYVVTSGTVNGNAAGAAEYDMTVDSDTAYIPVASLGDNTNKVEIRAYIGIAMWPAAVDLTKDIALPPPPATSSGAGSSSVNGGASGTVISTTPAVLGTISATTPAGVTAATLVFDGDVFPDFASAGSSTGVVQFQRLIAGTWTNVGATASSAVSYNRYSGPSDGSIRLSITDSGLTAATAYQWRLVGYLSSGTNPVNINGQITETA